MKTKSNIISLLAVLFTVSFLFASCQKEKIDAPKKQTVAIQNGQAIGDAAPISNPGNPR